MFRSKAVPLLLLVASAATLLQGQSTNTTTNAFVNFETAPVHPLDISPDFRTLAAANLPDGHVEIFDIADGSLHLLGSVPVGIDPVTVRFRSDTELWVVNAISDSISIIRLPDRRVVATLAVADSPADVIFAGEPLRAFVSCAVSNVIQVFDPIASPRLVRTIAIEGDRPKALAKSPDGQWVYAAIFESGNSSTILASDFAILNGFPPASVVDFPQGPYGGQNPPPNFGALFQPPINPLIPPTNPPPRVSVIVKKDKANRWLDDNEGDWTEFVSGTNAFFTGRPLGWDIADNEVAVINAVSLQTKYVNRLMNICMSIAVNPVSGDLTVVGTDASNEIRFEPNLRGVFVKAKIARIALDGQSPRAINDLNPHLDYRVAVLPADEKKRSLGDPRGIVWNAAGTRAYVAGMGSDNIIALDRDGRRVESQPPLEVAAGPVGLALDANGRRLYVLSRFANAVSVIDTEEFRVLATTSLHDPTPAVVKAGRRHLYNTQETSGLGQAACASCHVDGRFDRVAWDLGVPSGTMAPVTVSNRNFSRFPPTERRDYHPMKGPMMTQTLQDIIGHEPFHWRGDRDGLEQFNAAFTNLQGAASALTTNEMQEFKQFLATIHFPPNPYRTISNTLPGQLTLSGFTALGHRERPAGTALTTGSPFSGLNTFRQAGPDGCIHCHSLPTGLGPHMTFVTNRWRDLPPGPNGERHIALIGVRRSDLLPFKIPSLRSLNEKIGANFQKTGSRSGFGLLHDGSVDSLVRFLQDSFNLRSDQETADVIAFLLCLSGSDLPQGTLTDPDRPIGVTARDVPAGVGKQFTTTNAVNSRSLSDWVAMVNPNTSRVDLVVRGFKTGQPRGWTYDRLLKIFRSDRLNESASRAELESLAGPDSPITFMLVPRGAGTRIGIDRDGDGFPNRTELDFGSDPADPLSTPVQGLTIRLFPAQVELSWSTHSNKTYAIESAVRLPNAQWFEFSGPIVATGAVTRFSPGVDTGPAPQRYFRVKRIDGPPPQ